MKESNQEGSGNYDNLNSVNLVQTFRKRVDSLSSLMEIKRQVTL